MEYVVCQVSELEEKKPYAVEINGIELGVILSNGEVYAYQNNCPHFGGPVCLGEVYPRIKLKLNEEKMAVGEYVDETDLRLVCPWHSIEFQLETGKCTVDSSMRLRKYHTFINAEQVIVQI